MVQQLSLFGSINDDSYDLFVSTITTLSGTPPILFSKLSTNWKPNPQYDIEGTNAKNQLVEPNRINLHRELTLDQLRLQEEPAQFDYNILKKINQDHAPFDLTLLDKILKECNTNGDDKKHKSWVFSMSDIPATGNNRKVSVQTIYESLITSTAGIDSVSYTHLDVYKRQICAYQL